MAVTASHHMAMAGLECKSLYFRGAAQPLEEREFVRQAVGCGGTLPYGQALAVLTVRWPAGYGHPANINYRLLAGSAEKGCISGFCLARFPNP